MWIRRRRHCACDRICPCKKCGCPEQTRDHDIRLNVCRLVGWQAGPLAVGENTHWVTNYYGEIAMRVLYVSPIRSSHFPKWTHWDLNPGPSACKADVIPLHHAPVRIISFVCKSIAHSQPILVCTAYTQHYDSKTGG